MTNERDSEVNLALPRSKKVAPISGPRNRPSRILSITGRLGPICRLTLNGRLLFQSGVVGRARVVVMAHAE
jgi:hypothetical protein